MRYADFLPEDVKALFTPYHAEILGRLVHTWRKKTNGPHLMRMCEHGAAFELESLSFTRDPIAFLSKLGEAGMLYVSPTTSGKMIYPVATAEGGQSTVTCFILGHHTVRRLALT